MKPAVGLLFLLAGAHIAAAEPANAGFAAPDAVLASETNCTVITSARLAFDQKNMTAVFEGGARVSDPQIEIQSDRLTVYFSNDKKARLIEAEGNVVISRETIKAMARRASYAVAEGKISLTGNPVVTREKDALAADTIVLWRNSGRIICEPNARLTVYSEKKLRAQFNRN